MRGLDGGGGGGGRLEGGVYLYVTECICTLCLCCCTLYVTLSVSVSSFFFCWVWGRIMTSFIYNNSFAYVLRIIILDVSETAREQGEGITTASRMHHQKKRRNLIRNLWLWLVCCFLLPTCYFHRPFTFRLLGFHLWSSLFLRFTLFELIVKARSYLSTNQRRCSSNRANVSRTC